jgi:hypothetical protein
MVAGVRFSVADLSGNTSLVGANLLFEMLCVLPGAVYRN